MTAQGWANFAWQSDFGQFYLIDCEEHDTFQAPAEPEIVSKNCHAPARGLVVYTNGCLQQVLRIRIYDREPEPRAFEEMSGKPWTSVETARVRYLSEAECVRLVNACAPAFRNLVRGALLTGCRYSELSALHAADFNADVGVVTVRESKAGKPRHVVLTDEGRRLFAGLTAGKLGNGPIFTRADGGVWGKSHQLRPMLEACRRAKIKPEISFHVLRHTHGSALAMKGVPMGVIAAQLGHADTRMTEKHYAHLAPSYVADTIRAHFPTLGIGEDSGVVPIRPALGKSAPLRHDRSR